MFLRSMILRSTFLRSMFLHCGALLAVLLCFSPTLEAQNVTGYDSMPDPFLFLLREPAVHKDLGLNASQLQRLTELNDSVDDAILGSRNKGNGEDVQRQTRAVNEKSRSGVTEIFSAAQLQRLRQITFRLKGMSFVVTPEAAAELQLTDKQEKTIKKAIADAREKLSKVQSREHQGERAHREAQRVAAAARKREQVEILTALNDRQKQTMVKLIGKPFDPASLGRASFKAPEIIDSSEWVNSAGMELSDLRGKVIALHFYAYG